jgi:hypothetical protein
MGGQFHGLRVETPFLALPSEIRAIIARFLWYSTQLATHTVRKLNLLQLRNFRSHQLTSPCFVKGR